MNPELPRSRTESHPLRRGTAAVALALAATCGTAGAATGGDPEVPGEVLVKLRSTAALQPLLARQPLTLVAQFGARPIYRLRVIGNLRVKTVLGQLGLEPDVQLAEANAVNRSPEARKNVAWAIGTPEAYAAQWAPAMVRMAEAQMLSKGKGVRVAVLDTGIDATHPALGGRVLAGYDFVDGDGDAAEGPATGAAWGHGTHVAGLVALMAPEAQIVPLRVLDADGNGNAWVLGEALLFAVNPSGNPAIGDGVHVINLSLGSLSRTKLLDSLSHLAACVPPAPDDGPALDFSDPGYNDDRARCANFGGAVIVAAAGNDASNSVKEYPAAEKVYGQMAVGASNAQQRLAAFSNSGSWVDLAAPGEGLTSALPGGAWGTWSGTSMAAPLVAGAAALLRAREPALAPVDVVRRITRSASVLCGTALRQLDAAAALAGVQAASGQCR